ncbi:MAG TPA: hypothetical protein VGF45_01735 [Polyangia bacterium]
MRFAARLLAVIVAVAGFVPGSVLGAAKQTVTAPGVATVALILPAERQRRAAEELRNEIEASQFAVLSVPGPNPITPANDRALAEALLFKRADDGGGLVAVLAVREALIVIYARTDGRLHEIELRGSQASRPARRRLGLSVVERLRQLREETASAPSETAAAVAKEGDSIEAPSLPPRPAMKTSAPAPGPTPLPGRRLWWFGATSDLNLVSSRGTPTAHVSLIAERPLMSDADGPLSLTVRAAWPVLGAQLNDEAGRFIRTWTFAGEVGLRFYLRDRTEILRPVLGAAVGVRSALTDTGEFEMRASRVVMLPALSYAANAGLRFRLRPRVDLVGESDLSQAWLPVDVGRSYERAAAEEWLLRFSLGVAFEY